MENLAVQDGEVYLIRSFFRPAEADCLLDDLHSDVPWQEESIVMFGKPAKVPRLVCWVGDPQALYRYSGVLHRPLPWNKPLREIKQRIESFCGKQFNSVLANLYRDGNDSMGWHADKEKELGNNPYIASQSFGAERLFRLRHNKTKQTLDIYLQHGDLLLMGGTLQRHWRHCVPKTGKPLPARINLTFRQVFAV